MQNCVLPSGNYRVAPCDWSLATLKCWDKRSYTPKMDGPFPDPLNCTDPSPARRAHPASCSIFIECQGSQSIVLPCQPGTYFEPLSQRCLNQESVLAICVNGSTIPPDVVSTTEEYTTTEPPETTVYLTTVFGKTNNWYCNWQESTLR